MKLLTGYAVYLLSLIIVFSTCLATFREIPVDDFVFRISFTDDDRLGAAITGNKVVILDLAHSSKLCELSHPQQVLYAQFRPKKGPKEPQFIITCSDNKAFMWNLDSKDSKPSIFSHSEKVVFIKVSPCGRYLITVCEDGEGTLWNLETGKQQNNNFLVHYDSVATLLPVDFSVDGSLFASITTDKSVVVHQTADHSIVTKFLVSDTPGIISFGYSSDTSYLITGSRFENKITMWDLKTNIRKNISFKSSGSNLIDSFVVNKNQVICIYDKSAQACSLFIYDLNDDAGNEISLQIKSDDFLTAHTVCSNAPFLNAYASSNGTVGVWNIKNVESGNNSTQLEPYVHSLGLSPSGKFLLSHYNDKPFGSKTDRHAIGIWQVE